MSDALGAGHSSMVHASMLIVISSMRMICPIVFITAKVRRERA